MMHDELIRQNRDRKCQSQKVNHIYAHFLTRVKAPPTELKRKRKREHSGTNSMLPMMIQIEHEKHIYISTRTVLPYRSTAWNLAADSYGVSQCSESFWERSC
jgi:hypothetical protein